MKTMNFTTLRVALLAIATTLLTACNNEEEPKAPSIPTPNDTTLSGSITTDITLKRGQTYRLHGEYIVESGATLTIEPGVRIVAVYDDIVDYILVKQGAKIMAQGTADAPIVMTSERQEPGAWGGIHICGKALTNAEGGKGNSEIGGATYGGNDATDNSGTLRYVRVEYTGYAFDEDHEANGITFYAVGSGTTVDNCQAYMGSDDGFEFFGGSVNVSNMVVTNCSDDSYDWTEGWNGQGTNLVAYQESPATLGYDCDCLIEADNNENNFAATPTSHPTLSNLVLVGNNSAENKRGIRLRRGTKVSISNATVCGKPQAITTESLETENALKSGRSILSNITASTTLASREGVYTSADFEAENCVDASLAFGSYSEVLARCPWITGSWVR